MNSNFTQQFPRTIQQTRLGPYATSHNVQPMPEPRRYSTAWCWAMWACAAASAVVIALTF